MTIQPERNCSTYIAIPQTGGTFAVVLSNPFRLRARKMGVNKKGVASGPVVLKKPARSTGVPPGI